MFTIPRARLGVHHLILIMFMAWGLARTLPYVGTYGLDALRDAATWYYATFAIAVSLTVRPHHVALLVRLYRRLIPIFLVWFPIAAVLTIFYYDAVPRTPGSQIPIVLFKAGDMAVQLAGVGAFILLGLYARSGATSPLREFWLWTLWILNAGIAASLNRAAITAGAAIAAVLLFVRASSRWLTLIFVATALLLAVSLADPQVDFGGPRSVSVGQLVDNLVSIVSGQGGTSVNQATKEWRVQWWDSIVNYTVNGPYFWTGKGFGINLANADGFQVLADQSLRAPHSTNFEILARAGVPGFGLWVVLQITFGLSLLRAAFVARRGAPAWIPILGWVFVYWLAALIDGSFDVYLGSPHGGIWFWSVIGLGIASIRLAGEKAPLDLGGRRPGDDGTWAGSDPPPGIPASDAH